MCCSCSHSQHCRLRAVVAQARGSVHLPFRLYQFGLVNVLGGGRERDAAEQVSSRDIPPRLRPPAAAAAASAAAATSHATLHVAALSRRNSRARRLAVYLLAARVTRTVTSGVGGGRTVGGVDLARHPRDGAAIDAVPVEHSGGDPADLPRNEYRGDEPEEAEAEDDGVARRELVHHRLAHEGDVGEG
eukprot:scaffold10045_cov64-Phaeocystis_antarctica.AAC.5